MSRWTWVVVLAVVAMVSACKKKQAAEPAPVAEMTPIKDPAPTVPEIAEPALAIEVPSPPSGLPPSCERYGNAIRKLARCTQLPQATRDALRRSYEQTKQAWESVPSEGRAALDTACAAAADAVQQSGGACDTYADDPAPTPSRDVPSERGVPLDRAVLGSLAHPFGALEVLKPGIARDEILAALPNAQRDGEDAITVPLGVDDLMARIDLDYTGHLDVVRIRIPGTAKDLLGRAWGKPSAAGTWFDRKRHWRADLDDDNELMIGPFTPLAELLGKGPDGLAETKGIVGATPAELTARFGTRTREIELDETDGTAAGEKRLELLLPATEHCKFFTHAEAEVANGRVSKLHLGQCYDDDAQRRAALASMESKWGRASAGRSADDRPVFTFALPGRKVEVTIDDEQPSHPGWQIVISAK